MCDIILLNKKWDYYSLIIDSHYYTYNDCDLVVFYFIIVEITETVILSNNI